MITTPTAMIDYITVPISLLLTTALGENSATLSRQKGAHKGAKAAEVEAVGATGQCPEARVTGEGGGGGTGGLDRREWEGGGFRPCILLKLRTEGVDGWICSGGVVGCRELIKAIESFTDNLFTGHITVELSLFKAIPIHEVLKSFVTTATKALTSPLRLAIVVELGQSLEDLFNGDEEIYNACISFFVFSLDTINFYVGEPGGTIVSRGVGRVLAGRVIRARRHNAIPCNFPLFGLRMFILVAYEHFECVGERGNEAITTTCSVLNLFMNHCNECVVRIGVRL
ncbi:uncharacterized protein BcabD6B2_41020 [Babesia caballi]|uniref:Uncharacterized protein n=1 Tax=Babesia caballi TaxID=5871 RepID=A0AAV4LXY1_BABCB|nr:hypothetical protein BcabD6B2_41020 [Babesia caballi]